MLQATADVLIVGTGPTERALAITLLHAGIDPMFLLRAMRPRSVPKIVPVAHQNRLPEPTAANSLDRGCSEE